MTGKAKSLCAVLVCAIAVGIAQQFGSVTGIVTDTTGGVVPNAEVQLSNQASGFSKQLLTDNSGSYLFKDVPSGSYGLEIRSRGFLIFKGSVSVAAGSVATVNAVLQIGGVAETIIITATAPGINTSASSGPLRPVPAQGIRVRSAKSNTEQYDYFVENEFATARRNPLSTFSADVDTASYSNVRRFLRRGELPPPDSIRVEELINYFSYDYPAPQGNEPFSVTKGVATCPWKPQNKLVHIGIRTPSVKVNHLPPANLVFLIDVSGSMSNENKLPLVQRSLRLLVEQLREKDSVGIVVYAGAAGVVLPTTSGRDKVRILRAIDELAAGGSTYGSAGIKAAYQLARESFIQGGNNRVILATDGDFNVGVSSDGELVRLVESERESGVFLTVLGFGMGNYKDSRMEKLADHGNGSYAYIDSLREARKVLVEQMSGTLLTVAKDVKFQMEFNPARVKAYRLIGYENRVLQEHEFNDDKKDAGDVGAGMAVTALYEVVPAGSSQDLPAGDELRYQQTAPLSPSAKRSKELGMLKIRYKAPQESKSRLVSEPVLDSSKKFAEAPAEMRFAAAVAEYGLLLRKSKFASASSYDHAISVAESTRGSDRAGYRAEFIDLMKSVRAIRQSVGGSQ